MNRSELWRELRKYPSAIAGLLIILGLVALSVYTVIALPYEQAVTLWRGGENLWTENPRNAAPRWLNLLPGPKRSETLKLDSAAGAGHKEIEAYAEDFKEVRIDLPVPFEYDTFPKELTVFISATYASKRPHVSFTWVTPDGREIDLGERTLRDKADTYRVSQDTRLQSRLRGQPAHIGLFADPAAPTPTPLKGIHHLVIEGLLFESASDLDVKLIVYGELYGWAGTDERRRDLAVALLWGAPIALSFGLLAAVGATGATMVIAATSAWYGRWVDALLQRLTEVNLILPVLPILIMIGTLYSRSIWVMLGAVIALSIFGGGVKTYRAIFLQVREAPYIEAAKAYGASNGRIIFRYMIPRIVPVLVPQFVVIIPSYVFLEATLSVLGLGDPLLPTWGKLLDDARRTGALFNGYYYLMIEPAVLLMLTGLGFAMLGFALDRVFNPKLREM